MKGWAFGKSVISSWIWRAQLPGPGMQLAEVLSDLFGAEGADPVESETENQPVFFPQADIEGSILRGHRAAIPGVSQGDGRANQRVVSLSGPLLKIKEERSATKQAALAIADKD